jgi:hypothetical protein
MILRCLKPETSKNNPVNKSFYWPHFIDQESKAQRGKLLAGNRVAIK